MYLFYIRNQLFTKVNANTVTDCQKDGSDKIMCEAKVAGTEIGVVEPQATFSACFGAPFMPMHPSVYANLLSQKVAENNSSCWLINTGWVAGGYGKSDRIKIRWTRALLNAALDGTLNNVEFVVQSYVVKVAI